MKGLEIMDEADDRVIMSMIGQDPWWEVRMQVYNKVHMVVRQEVTFPVAEDISQATAEIKRLRPRGKL